jgi:hypothetical protein
MRLTAVRRAGTWTPLAAGCALGLATIGVLVLVPGTSARAAGARPAPCRNIHANVEGYDARLPGAYGNQGYIYVNSRGALAHLRNFVARSLFVIGPGVAHGRFLNDVEIGWTAGPGRLHIPEVYSEWVSRGVDSKFRRYPGYRLRGGASFRFRVQDPGRHSVWQFLAGNRSRPFGFSPRMDFSHGYVLTNSEHYNTCDSLYARFHGLRYASAPGRWQPHYLDLRCYLNDSRGWYFHRVSNYASAVTDKRGSCGAGKASTASTAASQADPLVRGRLVPAAAASAAAGFPVPTPRPDLAGGGFPVSQAWVNRPAGQVALVLDRGRATVMMWPVAPANRNAAGYFRAFLARHAANAYLGRVGDSPALIIRPHTDADRANPAWVEFYRDGVDINIYSTSDSAAGLVRLAGSMG